MGLLTMTSYLRPFATQTYSQTLRTFTKPAFSSQVSRITTATMSTNPSNLKIETKNVQTAPGVTLSEQQNTIVGSVLDLFAGRPSLPSSNSGATTPPSRTPSPLPRDARSTLRNGTGCRVGLARLRGSTTRLRM